MTFLMVHVYALDKDASVVRVFVERSLRSGRVWVELQQQRVFDLNTSILFTSMLWMYTSVSLSPDFIFFLFDIILNSFLMDGRLL